MKGGNVEREEGKGMVDGWSHSEPNWPSKSLNLAKKMNVEGEGGGRKNIW